MSRARLAAAAWALGTLAMTGLLIAATVTAVRIGLWPLAVPTAALTVIGPVLTWRDLRDDLARAHARHKAGL